MYYRCNQCFRVIRDSNLEKHFKKCKGTSFNCCDCNEEFTMETYQNHTNCPNAIKTILPPVYNPKSKVKSPSLDLMRILDRLIYNHKKDEDQQPFERLALLDNIPKKETSFVGYASQFCHITKEQAKELWEEIENLKQEQLMDKRGYRADKKQVNKSLKAEAKKVQKKEEREMRKEKRERKEEKLPVVGNTSKYEKQVTKLMRMNLDNYKQKEDLKKAVIDIIRERDENADVDAITAVFEKKYPSMRG